MCSPWYALVAEAQDVILPTTIAYAGAHGLKNLHLPVTTRTITCPTALGSDSEPVPVTVSGVRTYLADSMQFALEYGCRLARSGCFTIMPSFRGEEPDETHLGQFTHSEAELIGDLDDVIGYVSGYVRALASAILDRLGDRLAICSGGVSHIQRMADSGGFEQLTFEEAVRIVRDVDGAVQHGQNWRSLTRRGERALLERVSEFVWVRDFDSLAVPFYQASNDDRETAKCADLFFGMGEIVGSGERHSDAEELRKSMALHGVNEADYEWYTRMRETTPLRTAGFGMGVERFLMWVFRHDDIRDLALISRVDEPKEWPKAVARP